MKHFLNSNVSSFVLNVATLSTFLIYSGVVFHNWGAAVESLQKRAHWKTSPVKSGVPIRLCEQKRSFKDYRRFRSLMNFIAVNYSHTFKRQCRNNRWLICKIKMIGEIRQNFTEAGASVGLILATALLTCTIVTQHVDGKFHSHFQAMAENATMEISIVVC